jgi:cytoskeletal protein RodZ
MAYRGKTLKNVRLEKRVELRSIANETRINMAYLEDLERERFDRFPGRFYFTSFSKAYANSLGLDPEEVAFDLNSAYEEWENGDEGEAPAKTIEEEGLIGRIAGLIRRAQEV